MPRLTRRKIEETVERAQEEVRRRGPAFRMLWLLSGTTLLFLGLVLIFLPGPAVLVVALGLAMLSAEFAWASRLVDVILDAGFRLPSILREATRPQVLLGIVAAVLLLAAIALPIVIR